MEENKKEPSNAEKLQSFIRGECDQDMSIMGIMLLFASIPTSPEAMIAMSLAVEIAKQETGITDEQFLGLYKRFPILVESVERTKTLTGIFFGNQTRETNN